MLYNIKHYVTDKQKTIKKVRSLKRKLKILIRKNLKTISPVILPESEIEERKWRKSDLPCEAHFGINIISKWLRSIIE